jgi:ParB family chromosome partitioning protein
MNVSALAALKADKTRLGYVGRQPGTPVRDSDEWYTPLCFIELARAVMGSIDLDPFSSATANRGIRAAYYFDTQRSALASSWRNTAQRRKYPQGVNVWMNPPYAMPLIHQAVGALLAARREGHVAQAIVLVNNATETRWFQCLCAASTALCFPKHRIAFRAPDGKAVGSNTRGQAFFYLAHTRDATAAFLESFAAVGVTLLLKESCRCQT